MTNEELIEILRNQGDTGLLLDTPYENLLLMTDEQAADIIEDMYFKPQSVGGRHNGKTLLQACRIVAVAKAINRLRGKSDDKS